ncbi:MAG: STAS domain-containing protein [Armatimonadota bacterium]
MNDEPMQLSTRKAAKDPSVTIVDIKGEVSDEYAEEFAKQIRELVSLGRRRVVLNMADVTFITTRGIAECVAAAKRLRDKGGDIRIAGAKGDVWRVIENVWLHRMIRCCPNVNEAVGSF